MKLRKGLLVAELALLQSFLLKREIPQGERTNELYRREKTWPTWREKYYKNNYFCHNDGMFATTSDYSFSGLVSFTANMDIQITINNDEMQPSGVLLNKWHRSNVNGNGVKEVLLPAGSCFIIEKVEEPSGPIGPSNRVKIEMSRVYDPRADYANPKSGYVEPFIRKKYGFDGHKSSILQIEAKGRWKELRDQIKATTSYDKWGEFICGNLLGMKTNGNFQGKSLFKNCESYSYAEAFKFEKAFELPNLKRLMWIYDPDCYKHFADQEDSENSENAKCEVILWRTE